MFNIFEIKLCKVNLRLILKNSRKFFSLDTKDESESEDTLNVLENIDDDLDRLNVAMVKVGFKKTSFYSTKVI